MKEQKDKGQSSDLGCVILLAAAVCCFGNVYTAAIFCTMVLCLVLGIIAVKAITKGGK